MAYVRDKDPLNLTDYIRVNSPSTSSSKILSLCEGKYPCDLIISLTVRSVRNKNIVVIKNPLTGKEHQTHISILETVLKTIEYQDLK